jgi:dUTP pyrophosphatase
MYLCDGSMVCMTEVLKIQRIDKDVPLPSLAHKNDAAFDVYASEKVVLRPGERVQVPTGIKMEIPNGYVIFIWDRSSLSHKHGLKTLGGVIDEVYRGEVKVGLVNLSDEEYVIEKHHRVAQMVLQKKIEMIIEEVDVLSDTDRGEGGFGSTGK